MQFDKNKKIVSTSDLCTSKKFYPKFYKEPNGSDKAIVTTNGCAVNNNNNQNKNKTYIINKKQTKKERNVFEKQTIKKQTEKYINKNKNKKQTNKTIQDLLEPENSMDIFREDCRLDGEDIYLNFNYDMWCKPVYAHGQFLRREGQPRDGDEIRFFVCEQDIFKGVFEEDPRISQIMKKMIRLEDHDAHVYNYVLTYDEKLVDELYACVEDFADHIDDGKKFEDKQYDLCIHKNYPRRNSIYYGLWRWVVPIRFYSSVIHKLPATNMACQLMMYLLSPVYALINSQLTDCDPEDGSILYGHLKRNIYATGIIEYLLLRKSGYDVSLHNMFAFYTQSIPEIFLVCQLNDCWYDTVFDFDGVNYYNQFIAAIATLTNSKFIEDAAIKSCESLILAQGGKLSTPELNIEEKDDDKTIWQKFKDFCFAKLKIMYEGLFAVWTWVSDLCSKVVQFICDPFEACLKTFKDKLMPYIKKGSLYAIIAFGFAMVLRYFGLVNQQTLNITIQSFVRTAEEVNIESQASYTDLAVDLIRVILVALGLTASYINLPNVHIIASTLKDWNSLSTCIIPALQAIPRICMYVLGYDDQRSRSLADINEWMIRTQALIELRGIMGSANSADMLNRINSELTIYSRLSGDIMNSSVAPAASHRANTLLNMAWGIQSTLQGEVGRMIPFCIKISGKAGTGKTIFASTFREFMGPISTMNHKNPSIMSMYEVIYSDSYWNNFKTGQDDVILFDEFDQKINDEVQHTRAWTDFLYLNNHTTFRPPGAAIEDKSNLARPSFVLLTGNDMTFSNTGFQDVPSVIRRVNMFLTPQVMMITRDKITDDHFKSSDVTYSSPFNSGANKTFFVRTKDDGSMETCALVYIENENFRLCVNDGKGTWFITKEIFNNKFIASHIAYDHYSVDYNKNTSFIDQLTLDEILEHFKEMYQARFEAYKQHLGNNHKNMGVLDFNKIYESKLQELLYSDPYKNINLPPMPEAQAKSNKKKSVDAPVAQSSNENTSPNVKDDVSITSQELSDDSTFVTVTEDQVEYAHDSPQEPYDGKIDFQINGEVILTKEAAKKYTVRPMFSLIPGVSTTTAELLDHLRLLRPKNPIPIFKSIKQRIEMKYFKDILVPNDVVNEFKLSDTEDVFTTDINFNNEFLTLAMQLVCNANHFTLCRLVCEGIYKDRYILRDSERRIFVRYPEFYEWEALVLHGCQMVAGELVDRLSSGVAIEAKFEKETLYLYIAPRNSVNFAIPFDTLRQFEAGRNQFAAAFATYALTSTVFDHIFTPGTVYDSIYFYVIGAHGLLTILYSEFEDGYLKCNFSENFSSFNSVVYSRTSSHPTSNWYVKIFKKLVVGVAIATPLLAMFLKYGRVEANAIPDDKHTKIDDSEYDTIIEVENIEAESDSTGKNRKQRRQHSKKNRRYDKRYKADFYQDNKPWNLNIYGEGPKTIKRITINVYTKFNTWIEVPVNLFFGTYGVTYAHWYESALIEEEDGKKFITIIYKEKTYKLCVEGEKIQVYVDYLYDISVFNVDCLNVDRPRNCLTLFVDERTMDTMNTFNGVYITKDPSKLYEMYVYDNYITYKDSATDQVFSIPTSICSNCHTEKGDCGHLIVSKGPGISANKIVGMHVAGGDAPKDSLKQIETAYATLITRQLLEEIIIYEFEDENITNLSTTRDLQIVAQSTYEQIKDITGPNLIEITQVEPEKIVRLPQRSQLVPTVFSHDINTSHNKQPAKLDGFYDENPIYVAVQDTAASLHPDVDTNLIDECVVELKEYLDKTLNYNIIANKPLSERDAIAGIDGLLEPIRVSTSPGYPYVITQEGHGKYEYINPSDTAVYESQSFRKEWTDLENAILTHNNEYLDNLDFRWMMYLKDELRDVEKIGASKTRTIFCNSLSSIMLFRKYFSPGMVVINQSFPNSIFGIGANMMSEAADDLYKYLSSKGFTKVIAGDYSGFDRHYHPEFQKRSYEVLMDICRKACPIPDEIIEYFKKHEMSTKVQVNDALITFKTVHCSGNFFTTQENCIQNCLYMMYIFKTIYPNYKFFDHVVCNFVGDDHMLFVSNKVPEFNSITLYRTMPAIGQKYTDENKEIPKVKYRKFEECSYLGCSFRKIEGKYVGCLRQETLWNHICYTRNSDYFGESLNAFLDAASLWPLEFYNEYYNTIHAHFPDIPHDYLIRQQNQKMRKRISWCDKIAQGPEPTTKAEPKKVEPPKVAPKKVVDKPQSIEKPKQVVNKEKVKVKVEDKTVKKNEKKITTMNTHQVKPKVSRPRNNLVVAKNYSMSSYDIDLKLGPNSWMSIANIEWNPSHTVNHVLESLAMPRDMLTKNLLSMQVFPFLYSTYFTTDIEFQFQLSGSQFTAGMLTAVFMPLTGESPNPDEIFTGIHVNMSPTDQTVVTMDVPWRYIRPFMSCVAARSLNEILGSLHIMVSSPLSVAQGTDNCTLKVFGRFKNAHFYVPRKPTEIVAQGYSVADLIGLCPVGLATQVVTDTIYDCLHTDIDEFIPLDHPMIAGGGQPLLEQQKALCNTYGAHAGNSLQEDPRALYRNWRNMFDPAETKISFLLGRQHIIKRFEWKTTDAVDSTLLTIDLDSMFGRTTHNMLTALLNQFLYWHADCEFELMVIKTPIQNGRLRIGVDYNFVNTNVIQTDANYTFNQVLDFTQSKMVGKFVVPYCSSAEYLPTVKHVKNQVTSLGKLFIIVANKLSTTSAVTTNTVQCILTMRLVNAKVAGLTQTQIVSLDDQQKGSIILAQSEESQEIPSVKEDEEVNVEGDVLPEVLDQPEDNENLIEHEELEGSNPVYNQVTLEQVNNVKFTSRQIDDVQYKPKHDFEIFPGRQFERVITDLNEIARKMYHVRLQELSRAEGANYTSICYKIEVPHEFSKMYMMAGGGLLYRIYSRYPMMVTFVPYVDSFKSTDSQLYLDPILSIPEKTGKFVQNGKTVNFTNDVISKNNMVYAGRFGSDYYAEVYIPWLSTNLAYNLNTDLKNSQRNYGNLVITYRTPYNTLNDTTTQIYVAGADDFSYGIYCPLRSEIQSNNLPENSWISGYYN